VDSKPAPTANNSNAASNTTASPTSSNNQSNPAQVNNPASNQADSIATPKAKEKKSFFNKLKDKTKNVIKY
jgi:hypothetical protein